MYKVDAHQSPVLTCKFLNSKYFASGASNGEVAIWDLLDENHFISNHHYHSKGITTISSNPDDANTLLTGSVD